MFGENQYTPKGTPQYTRALMNQMWAMILIIAHNDFNPFILPIKSGILPLVMILITLNY